jgi:hypothetical protein
MLGAGELTFLAEARGPEYPSDQLLLPQLVLPVVLTLYTYLYVLMLHMNRYRELTSCLFRYSTVIV